MFFHLLISFTLKLLTFIIIWRNSITMNIVFFLSFVLIVLVYSGILGDPGMSF